MRFAVLALLAVAALAGCTAPDDEPDHPLLGVCPHWEPGDAMEVALPADVAPPLAMDGAPLDRFWIKVGETTGGELRAFAGERQRPVLDLAAGVSFPVIDLADRAGDVFIVGLTSPTHGTPADPSGIRLDLTGGSAQVMVTPMYRVCGMLA